jgi:hypothetical protein
VLAKSFGGDHVNERKGLPEATFHITIVTRPPKGPMSGYFTTSVLELNPRRLALLKRLVGDETWSRSRGFKDVPWSEVETSVDEVLSASRKVRHRESSVSKAPRRKARLPRQQ